MTKAYTMVVGNDVYSRLIDLLGYEPKGGHISTSEFIILKNCKLSDEEIMLIRLTFSDYDVGIKINDNESNTFWNF